MNLTKLRNTKVVYDGIEFDSKAEMRRYIILKAWEAEGRITDLELQKEYILIPAQYEFFPRFGKKGQRLKDGKRCIEQALKYVADFVYQMDGKTVVEDVKGYRDTSSAPYAKFVIKRKLMLYVHGLRIVEVG